MLKKTVLTFAFLTILTTFYGFNAQFSAPATDDALNALAAGKYRGDLPANTILTPHPGEAARLLGLTAPPQEGLDDYTAAPYRLSYPVYYLSLIHI